MPDHKKPHFIRRTFLTGLLILLYPGGGYFYTGHPFFGVGDTIVESILLVWLIIGVIDFFTGGGGPEGWASVLIPGVALIIEQAETIFHAKHYVNEYIFAEENSAPTPTS